MLRPTSVGWRKKAKEEGVMALPRGIYYKVLKQGRPEGSTALADAAS